MIATLFDGSFPHTWTAEVLPNRPMILPPRHYTYPEIVEEVERGALEVLISPASHPEHGAASAGTIDSQPFLATCALGFRDPAAPTGLWAMPDPDSICAISGGYAYVINTAQPDQFTMIRYRPVLQVLSLVEHGLLLFIGHHAILAWGRDGEAWQSDRMSAEGITIDRVEGAILYGTGWDMRTDKDSPFAVDLATGKRAAPETAA